jgi:hypothetical protein
MSTMTLMVDASQAPVGLVPLQDAVAQLARSLQEGSGKVQALVSDASRRFRSWSMDLEAPVVLMNSDIDPRILYTKLMPADMARVSKRVLYARDSYSCQYCGLIADSNRALSQLTVDHVKPARLFPSRLEATTWDNVVTACRSCNQRKGGLLPMEAHMMPRCTPKEPQFVQLRFAGRVNHPAQRDYVLTYFGLDPAKVKL